MAGDAISETLAIVRELLPNAPRELLEHIEALARAQQGGRRGYIGRRSKSTHLDRLEAAMAADADITNEQLAQMLGISVRQVQRYKPLVRGG